MRQHFDSEPINYEEAFRDLMAKRRRQRVLATLRRLDPRPTASSQVLLAGAALVVVGWILPFNHVALTLGLILLVVGFVTGLMRPRSRRVYWRQREIDLPSAETWATRLYRLLYRTS